MNRIQSENMNPGTPNWQLANPATDGSIEGYASLTSVNIGGTIQLFVNTTDSTYNIEVFRTGWYQGIGARLLMSMSGLTGHVQVIPPTNPATLPRDYSQDRIDPPLCSQIAGRESHCHLFRM